MRYVLVLLLAGCATTNYLAYEGPNEYEGHGGTRLTVDGIDLWQDGTPPKKFRLLGIITDVRGSGPVPQSSKNTDLARLAKAQGGDAVLLTASSTDYGGTFNAGTASAYGNSAYGTSVSVPMSKNGAKYWVVKYLN